MEGLLPISYWHWLILGLLLMILEVLSFTAILLWAGAGSFATALFAYATPTSSWQEQLLCFAVVTAFLLAITRLWLHRQDSPSEQPTLNRRADSLVGQIHPLTEPMVGGQGKIDIHDTLWLLKGPDLPLGHAVRIVSVEGSTLTVESAIR